jgi:hypothetical protein
MCGKPLWRARQTMLTKHNCLVDGLMEVGYRVHLADPAAIQ